MSGMFRIGTRGSRLALWQAEHIAARLKALGHPCELCIISTKGDRVQDLSFDKLEGKGFFTKELEEALLAGTIDLAVHSCKDLETRGPDGLAITAIAGRAAGEELILARPDAVDHGRPLAVREGAVVGTSSARRKAQLRAFRPDVLIRDLRGNVPTRVDKLRSGEYDAILLAKAGIDRLGLDLGGLHVQVLDPRLFVPAPAQGALAVQTRADDERVNAAVRRLHDPAAALTAGCEREVLRAYHGGCQVPLGVHVAASGTGLSLWASAASRADGMPRWIHLTGTDPDRLAHEAVVRLQGSAQPLRVTMTRAVQGDELMARVLHAHGLTLNGLPLFEPLPLPFDPVTGHDRTFFTSRNAVRFFVEGGGDLRDAPNDAVGPGTADELRKHGVEPGFVGEGPDTTTIAAAYAERFGGLHILFPCAEEGQRTVQRALAEANVIEVHVYAMRPLEEVAVPFTDVAVLTSPDNAEAFDTLLPLEEVPHLVAMGTSTARRIHELSGRDAIIPWASSEMALLNAVLHLATAP